MTILNVGLQRFRDIHHDDVTEIDWGDDGSAVLVTQTDVLGPIGDAQGLSLQKVKGTFANQFTAILGSATAVGEDVREIAIGNDEVKYLRNVFPTINHTSNDEIIIISGNVYERGN